MPTARRFDTLAAAFDHSVTASGLIFGHGYWTRSEYRVCDYYVVPLGSLGWAEAAGLQIVDDFSSIS